MSENFRTQSISENENKPLFNDYLNNFESVKGFYQWDYRQDWLSCFKSRLQDYQNRDKLKEILHDQNRTWKAPASTLHNIDLIGQKNTLAVVTGQQVGILGGPLYTIYKALNIIQLSQKLAQEYPQYNFVPCFWMEVGDNDFTEINHINLINLTNEFVRFSLPEQPNDFRSIHHRHIPDEIEKIFDNISENTIDSEFRENIISEAQKIYSPAESYADAFAKWLFFLFESQGLVVINPSDKRLKSLAAPIFGKALKNWKEILSKFQTVNQELENSGYHTQINFDSTQTMLFYQAKDEARARIEADDSQFLIRHPKDPYKISEEELSSQVEKCPEHFSPNVALRLIYQDVLLPTAAYIGGPSEISYLAQLKPLYNIYNMNQPIFYPRTRISLVEHKIQKLIRKYELEFHEIFKYRDKLSSNLVGQTTKQQLEKQIENARDGLYKIFEELGTAIQEVDDTLEPTVEKSRGQIDNAINKLQKKAEQAMERKLDTEIRQLNKIAVNLFPEGKNQERQLNIIYYLIKYGPDFIKKLQDSILIDEPDHQLIFV